jgi:transcriptional regulator with XRE-family HTH domain
MKQINGKQVRKVREMLSISQQYVAEQLGISQAAYSNIENGKTYVSMDKLFRIATALDVKAEAILKFDPKVALDACMMLTDVPKVIASFPKKQKRLRQGKKIVAV